MNLHVPAVVLVLTSTLACGTAAKQKVAETALDAMGPDQRRESFEATARVLDANPAYVDEFYRVARTHRPLMDRFVQNTARDLHDPELSKMNARHLVANPRALEQVFVDTTLLAVKDREARPALLRGMQRTADPIAEVIKDNPKTLAALTEALIKASLQDKPGLRKVLTKLGVLDD